MSEWLSSEELDPIFRLRSELDRERFVLSHADCLGLAPHCVPLGRGPSGKPRIGGVDQPLAFSLAHCQTHAVVAIARNALVGVDVE